MSVQNEINRIKLNISDSLDAIAAYGVPILTTDSSNELAERIALIANVLEGFVKYTLQTLTDVLKQQARANIGAIDSSYHDSTKLDTISDLNTIRSGAALGATALLSLPSNAVTTNTDLTIDSNKIFSKSISGNLSIVWNLLFKDSYLTGDLNINGITFRDNKNGSLTISGTASSTASYISNTLEVIEGHIYFVMGPILLGITISLSNYSIWEAPVTISGIGGLAKCISLGFTLYVISVLDGITVTNALLRLLLFDLTLMFGAGNEPTAELFKSMFPLNYYEYNSGSTIEKALIVGSNLSTNTIQAFSLIKINNTSITENQLQLLLTLINN